MVEIDAQAIAETVIAIWKRLCGRGWYERVWDGSERRGGSKWVRRSAATSFSQTYRILIDSTRQIYDGGG